MSRGLVASMNNCSQTDLSGKHVFRIGRVDSRLSVGDIFLPIASGRQDRVVAFTIAERSAAHWLRATVHGWSARTVVDAWSRPQFKFQYAAWSFT